MTDLLRAILRAGFTALFIGAGAYHLFQPEFFEPMMPPYIPMHTEVVLGTGVLEIIGGVLLQSSATRRWTGWALIAYLAAVMPVHIYMYQEEVYVPGMPEDKSFLALRIGLQVVMMGLLYFAAASPNAESA